MRDFPNLEIKSPGDHAGMARGSNYFQQTAALSQMLFHGKSQTTNKSAKNLQFGRSHILSGRNVQYLNQFWDD